MLSLAALVEEAGSSGLARHYSGNVSDLDVLLREDSLRVFEHEHGGVFAFLAFHPVADDAVAAYVAEGTLASDSGRWVLVFFTSFTDADTPRAVTRHTLGSGLTIETAELPAQQMTQILFTEKGAPTLPGLLVFKSFTEQQEAVYFGLDGLETAAEVRRHLRVIFSLIDDAAKAQVTRRSFADLLAVRAQRRQLGFTRSGRVSMRQWLVQAYQFANKHRAEIVTAFGLGAS